MHWTLLIRLIRRASLAAVFTAAAPHLSSCAADGSALAVGPQYDATHVYVAPADMDKFVASFTAVFGGAPTKQMTITVTPTPSRTAWRAVLTPAGMISLFGYTTPIPYPFGLERRGYLVRDLDAAIIAARAAGADVIVEPFSDAAGRDAIVQFPGGINLQLYWHKTPPHDVALQTRPENRLYVSAESADAFLKSFLAFSGGRVTLDQKNALGMEIGVTDHTVRKIQIESAFGDVVVFATNGHLPFPYGREVTGYGAVNLADALEKAKASGATVLEEPISLGERQSAILAFPGGYIAELHAEKPETIQNANR